jgi:hypothetical protein
MSIIANAAPSSANILETSRPIPLAAPVTKAIFPLRSCPLNISDLHFCYFLSAKNT